MKNTNSNNLSPIRSFELFVSLRYLLAKKKEKLVSLTSAISIIGVAVGVAALISVLAVMSGFDQELKEKIIGSNAHIIVQRDDGIEDPQGLMKSLEGIEHIAGMSSFITGQAIVRYNKTVQGVVVRGIEPAAEANVTKIKEYLQQGDLTLSANQIIVGNELAGRLGLKLGDTMDVISSTWGETYNFTIAGIFNSGMYDYDLNLVFVNIKDAEDIFSTQGRVTGLGIKIDDELKAEDVKKAINRKLGYPYWARTWIDSNRNLFSALKLEKTVMFIILTLIVIVASLNIASSLIMTVMEKTKDIGILKSVGATSTSIVKIFVFEGFLIGLIGTSLGAALGIFLSWLIKTYQFVKLPEDVYYIDKIPVKIEPFDIFCIILAALVISLFSTIYPSVRASKLEPVEALRYE